MIVHRVCIFLCVILLFSYTVAQNLVKNPSFENGASSWISIGNGFSVDHTTKHSGKSAILCTAPNKQVTKGAYQVIDLEQTSSNVVTISGWARSEGLKGDGSISIYADLLLMDGTWVRGVKANFNVLGKAYGWESASVSTSPGPIKEVWIYVKFEGTRGSVWFDDISVTEFVRSSEIPLLKPNPSSTVSATGALDSYYYLGLKYLFIATDYADIRLDVANLTLDALGVPYDVVIVPAFNGSFTLTDASGNGLYQGIVFATDLARNLTVDQVAQLNNYQIQFNVRLVVLYTWPYTTNGVEYKTSVLDDFDVYFTPASSAYISGYNHSSAFRTTGIWSFGSYIIDSTLATPALNLTYVAGGTGGEYVAAAFINRLFHGSELQFYIDQATWSAHAVGLGNFWFQYLSHNIYVGSRRIFLNMQLDDLFMNSDQWNITGEKEDGTASYRINASEIGFVSQWQNSINARLPAGSNVTISWPFNGATILEYGGYDVDLLYITVKSLLNQFVYQSHTFDHPELDNLTYDQVKAEMTDNFNVTLELFGGYNHPRYSNNSMVTPSISGLFNGNALRALWDVGIKNVVGDNSRPELRPTFDYHGVWTTNATNGFAGTYIVPREATYIYYDTNLPEQLVSEYNYYYRSYYGYNSTYEEILTREASRVALLLLAFRLDPYMFHQSNARSFIYNGTITFLTGHWANYVLEKYLSYYILPVYSHVQDLISQKWKDREIRDACGFSGQIKVDNTTKTIVGVQGTATASCTIGISGATITSPPTGVTVETYGPDTTVWYPVSPSHPLAYFNLAAPIPL